ncbi:MAG TPA: dipeptidase [Verrucomicrobiae bacterium]|nr:dipeptidase [Verrucomicrobiae bacterium]
MDPSSTVQELLRQVPLVDGHNDLPWQFLHRKLPLEGIDLSRDTSTLEPPLLTDIPRLRRGGVGAQFWAIYLPPKPAGAALVRAALEQIDLVYRMVHRYPKDFALALRAEDIDGIHRAGRIACLVGLEGGHLIDNSLAVLRMFHALGSRYLTLTHVKNNDWADAAGDSPAHHGLTPFGQDVVREMNRLGMLVDLSHVTDETMRAALRVSSAPVIFSHSSARAVCNHPRNVPDDLLRALRNNGGIVMACFLPGYLNEANSAHWSAALAEKERLAKAFPDKPDQVDAQLQAWRRAHPAPPATLNDVANHIDHLREAAGIDHVGIGSDFEGFIGEVRGLEDVSCYPALLEELLRRGYSGEDIKKIAGLNFLRVFRDVERVAAG